MEITLKVQLNPMGVRVLTVTYPTGESYDITPAPDWAERAFRKADEVRHEYIRRSEGRPPVPADSPPDW